MTLRKLRNNRWRLSYRGILVLVSICMVSIFLVILGFQYYFSIENYIAETLTTIEKSHLEQTGSNIDAQLDQMKNNTEGISSNDDFLDLVASYDNSGYSGKNQLQQSLEIILGKSANINRTILSIAIFTKNNVITRGDIALYDLKQSDLSAVEGLATLIALSDKSASFIIPSEFKDKDSPIIPSQIKELIQCYSFGINLFKDSENIGTLFVISNQDLFAGLLDQNVNNIVFDHEGNLLFNSSTKSDQIISEIYSTQIKNTGSVLASKTRDEILIYISSIGPGMNICFLQDKQEYLKRINNVRFFFIIFFIVLVFASSLLSGLLSRAVTTPLKDLTVRAKKYDLPKTNETDSPQQRKPRLLTLRESILAFLVCVVVISTTVLIISTYYFFSKIIDDFVEKTTRNTFDQTVENLNFYFNNAIYASENIIYTDRVQNIMNKVEMNDLEYRQLENMMVKGLPLYNGKIEITIYNRNGMEIISSLLHSNSPPIVENFINYNKSYIFGKTKKDIDGSYHIPIYMKIKNIQSYQTIGYFECRLNELDVEKLYNNLEKRL